MFAVNEYWAAACLTNGRLVDPLMACYTVKGFDERKNTPKDENPTSLIRSSTSKRSKISNRVRKEVTPVRDNDEHQREPTEPAHHQGIKYSATEASAQRSSAVAPADLLTECIVTAKDVAHLPIDLDDENPSQQETQNDDELISTESEQSFTETFNGKRKRDFLDEPQQRSKFQCMQPPNEQTLAKDGPNQHIIQVLQAMEDHYYSIQDQWRARAYRMGISTLKKQDRAITTKEQAESLPLIGERLAAKIEEVAQTKTLRRLENAKLEPTDKALKLFVGIYGVGFSQASTWVQTGYRSFQDLFEAKVDLTANQKIGIAHYSEFAMRIPRHEVQELGGIVERTLHEIDQDCQSIIGGSYRRGAKDSGDIDMIITKERATATELRGIVLNKLVPRLQKQQFLVAALAITNSQSGSKWHGACQLPLSGDLVKGNRSKVNVNPWRRIDFLLVPFDEIGAATLYFTGNDLFNRSMRLLARKKGMRLNQKGLYSDVLRHGTVKLSEGTKIAGQREEDIFRALGVPWREPCERNI